MRMPVFESFLLLSSVCGATQMPGSLETYNANVFIVIKFITGTNNNQ
jgi:hypothetical protein